MDKRPKEEKQQFERLSQVFYLFQVVSTSQGDEESAPDVEKITKEEGPSEEEKIQEIRELALELLDLWSNLKVSTVDIRSCFLVIQS